jgi:hypothetical protein
MTSLFHQLLILTAEYHILTLKLTRAFDDFNDNLLLIKPLHSMIKSINRLNHFVIFLDELSLLQQSYLLDVIAKSSHLLNTQKYIHESTKKFYKDS